MLWLHSGENAVQKYKLVSQHTSLAGTGASSGSQAGWQTACERSQLFLKQLHLPVTFLIHTHTHTNTTFPLHENLSCSWVSAKLARRNRQEMAAVSPPWWGFRRRLSLCQTELYEHVFVWARAYLYMQRAKTRQRHVILSSLPGDYRDLGLNEAVNGAQCCTLRGWKIRLIL